MASVPKEMTMLDKYKKGPVPAHYGEQAYVSIHEYPGDGHNPDQDGDQTELHGQIVADRDLLKAHLREKS